MITKREAKEIVDWVVREITRRNFSYVTDGRLDLSKSPVGAISGTQTSGGPIADGAIWNRHVHPNADIRGTKVRIATTAERGTVQLGTDGVALVPTMSGLLATASGLGASLIGIEDSPDVFVSEDVEAVLHELYDKIVAIAFLDLTDTPSNYTNRFPQVPTITEAEAGLEWRPVDYYDSDSVVPFLGYALSFDGDDEVNCGHDGSLNLVGDLSIEIWINPDADNTGAFANVYKFDSGYKGFRFGVRISSTDFAIGKSDGGYESVGWSHDSLAGTDAYVVVTKEGTTVKCYINNVAQADKTLSDAVINDHSTVNLLLGHNPWNAKYLKGKIAQVRISNVARTQAEITANYNGGAGRKFPLDANTVALWQIDEGAGATVYDETDNDNDGTIDGATWTDSIIYSRFDTDYSGAVAVRCGEEVVDAESATMNNILDGGEANGYYDIYGRPKTRIGSKEQISKGNYTEFEADGTHRFAGESTVWEDLRTPTNMLKTHSTKPPVWTDYKGGQVLAFEDQAVNYQTVYFTWQMPHAYKLGTTLYPHVHIVPEDDTAGDVYWEFTYSIAEKDGIVPNPTTVNTVQAMPAIADQHKFHYIATISGSEMPASGDDVSTMLLCSLTRRSDDALDTFNGKSVYLLEVDLHYEIDTVGSRQELIK